MKTHGLAGTRDYRIWSAMKTRCSNRNFKFYKYYGGRGIKVCRRWRESFSHFLADMGPCPHDLTIERIDNDGNYTPKNCRWASRHEQNQNCRPSPLHKLTRLDIQSILALKGTDTQLNIARRFNVAQQHVSRIFTGKRSGTKRRSV